MTKIAVNARALLHNRLEGIGWFTHEVARRLAARHPEWDFLFLFDRPYHPSFIYGAQVRPLVIPPPARHPLLWHYWYQYALPRVFRREKPDVFLSLDGHASLRASTPTLLALHDIAHDRFPEHVPWAARRYYQHFVPHYARRAERLVTVSEFSRSHIAGRYGLDPARVSVAGNGARPGFRPLSEAEKQAVRARYVGGRAYFIYIGSINPRKNIPRLLRAFDRFKAESGAADRLLLAGAFGWLSAEARRAYQLMRYQKDVILLGYVPEAELPGLLGAARALVYVSLFEGFGLPVLEAMETETPVICSDAASLPEVAGAAALLVDPYDEGAIAAAMTRLRREEGLPQSLVEEGRRQRRRFSWEKTTDVVERGVVELLNAHK